MLFAAESAAAKEVSSVLCCFFPVESCDRQFWRLPVTSRCRMLWLGRSRNLPRGFKTITRTLNVTDVYAV